MKGGGQGGSDHLLRVDGMQSEKDDLQCEKVHWPLQTDSVAGREALTSSESNAVAVIISALPSQVRIV